MTQLQLLTDLPVAWPVIAVVPPVKHLTSPRLLAGCCRACGRPRWR